MWVSSPPQSIGRGTASACPGQLSTYCGRAGEAQQSQMLRPGNAAEALLQKLCACVGAKACVCPHVSQPCRADEAQQLQTMRSGNAENAAAVSQKLPFSPLPLPARLPGVKVTRYPGPVVTERTEDTSLVTQYFGSVSAGDCGTWAGRKLQSVRTDQPHPHTAMSTADANRLLCTTPNLVTLESHRLPVP